MTGLLYSVMQREDSEGVTPNGEKMSVPFFWADPFSLHRDSAQLSGGLSASMDRLHHTRGRR